MEFGIESLPLGGVHLIRLQGSLTLMNATQLRERLKEEVEKGHTSLVLDFSRVHFIDSSGLGAIISVLRAARLAGGDVRLARVNDKTARLLRVTGLDRVLRIHSTIEDAAAVFDMRVAVGA